MADPHPDPTWITRLDPEQDPQARPDGVRLAVKDCIDVAGVPTTAGSPAVAAVAEPAAVDAACLSGARDAGARIVGKANLHELCFGSSGVNPHYGTPVNPLDPRRVPGGSSSGSAVAVASGEVDVGIGTDTTGSIRTPAACCGVVGLKTTWSLVPVAGVRPLAPSLDTVGVLARSVADLAVGATLLDPRLTDGDLTASPTIGRFRLPDTDPTIDAAIDSALLDAGFLVDEVELPGWATAHAAALTVLFGEALLVNEDLWEHHRDSLGEDVLERFTFAQAIGPAELGEARGRREAWRTELAEVLGTVGVLALPAMATYPARIGSHAVAPNAAAPAISLSGHPALALPVPSGGLLPASIQLVAPDHHEPRLLATAAAIEAAVAAAG
ncbi:amidase [Aquihabitans sp. G128]|uniref:amidase n=1 Tax=Aquihabitans sp. G128 TaxID=2849779 RepID=UPI001C2260C3|nr:amidase [Aquihabitans sp. G128]QXC63026.1 amidase [Aquihabitans sp. G128]